MNQITFDAKRIAEGYLNRPWLHKKVMEQFVKDCKITSNFQNGLDVGCGAGLSTKALRLICDRVTGTDISEQMIQVCQEEYKNDKAYTFYRAKAEETKAPAEKYDIVTANILADVLVPLTPVIVNQMKPGAVYITSGIIDDKEPTVVDAVKAAGLEILEVTYQGEWVSVTARKQA